MKYQDRVLAKRYGRAFIAACAADFSGDTEALVKLRVLLEPVIAYLNNPLIPALDKDALLKRASASCDNKRALSLAKTLLAARRFYLLDAIIEHAHELGDEREKIVPAEVKSAKPMRQGEQELLKIGLEKLSGAKVRLAVEEDAALIGGFSARMGDLFIDGSARGALERLKRELEA
jgi:F-type H+-transporting ATPase subunit delta